MFTMQVLSRASSPAKSTTTTHRPWHHQQQQQQRAGQLQQAWAPVKQLQQ
jgi:hypothetical protein